MSALPDSWRDQFLAAARFLTCLSLAGHARFASADIEAADSILADDGPNLAESAWAFPLVGLIVGAIGGIAYAIALALDLPPLAGGLIALAATMLTTGALHEDGLADTADGFGGGATRERKLEIMRDSRIGSFGVIALVLSIGLRAAAIADIGTRWHVVGALIAAHALGRGVLPAALRQLQPARGDGLGASVGRPEQNAALIALGIAVLLAIVGSGIRAGLVAAIAAALVAIFIGWLAQRQIGGQTGDVLGAIEQGAETAALLAIAAWS
jgi:adenosylcobinamide-GDP ribazoletransferase